MFLEDFSAVCVEAHVVFALELVEGGFSLDLVSDGLDVGEAAVRESVPDDELEAAVVYGVVGVREVLDVEVHLVHLRHEGDQPAVLVLGLACFDDVLVAGLRAHLDQRFLLLDVAQLLVQLGVRFYYVGVLGLQPVHLFEGSAETEHSRRVVFHVAVHELHGLPRLLHRRLANADAVPERHQHRALLLCRVRAPGVVALQLQDRAFFCAVEPEAFVAQVRLVLVEVLQLFLELFGELCERRLRTA